MDIVISDSGSRRRYPPIESGTYPAVCYGMVVVGTTYNKLFGNSSTKVVLLWELPTERIEIDTDNGTKDMPRGISKTYTLSLNEKANLRKDLESWRGKPISEEEIKAGFSVGKVVGAACFLSVIEDTKQDGSPYNRVAGVAKLPKTMEAPAQENATLMYDIRNNSECPLSAIASMPEWLQERIKESDEYKAREGETDTAVEPSSSEEGFEVVSSDDDLPF